MSKIIQKKPEFERHEPTHEVSEWPGSLLKFKLIFQNIFISRTYINSNDIILYYIASSSHLDFTIISKRLKPFLKIWSSSPFSVLMIKTKISLSRVKILRLTAKWPWLCKPSLNSNFLQKVMFDFTLIKIVKKNYLDFYFLQ